MRALALAVLLTLASSTALADAVGPPMTRECPAGSRAETNHCGTVCMIRACATDADCSSGESCAERSLCAEEIPCGGWGGTYSIAHSDCAGGCAEGTCQSVRSCGPPNAPDAGAGGPTHVTWNCGCRVAGPSRSSAWIAAALALALIARRRPSQRRRSARR